MKFFVLLNPRVGRGDSVTDFVPADNSPTHEAPTCRKCGKFIGMMPLASPIRAQLEAWGPHWGDVAFGPGDQILISDRFKALITAAGLAGFACFDSVEIVKTKKRNPIEFDPPVYWLASICRSEASLNDLDSGLVRDAIPPCDRCRIGGIIKRVRRIVIQENTWTGEDVFFARGLPGTILASEKFKRLGEAELLRNCVLVAAEDFSFDCYSQEYLA